MNSKRLRDVLLVAALLAVAALVLRASLRSPSDLNWLDRIVLRGSAPVQATVSHGTGWIGDAWRRYVHLTDVAAQNRGLEAETGSLEACRKKMGGASSGILRSAALSQQA